MTTHSPRDYQLDVEQRAEALWLSGARNVLEVMPTGAGKTFLFSRHISRRRCAVAIAHRSELVGQISLALAREGVRHRIIGARTLSAQCSAEHLDELGRDYVDPGSRIAAASVDTLLGLDPTDVFFAQCELWVCDEAHHLAFDEPGKPNKWARAVAMFPNALGLGVTATPLRSDGKGLGRHADGVFDAMVVGPPMRELINRGYLTDYRIINSPSDIDLSAVNLTASGDYSKKPLGTARKKSRITGDVVKEYLKYGKGKLGVTFDVDVENATETAAAFRAAGVPAEVITGKTPHALRREILKRFKRREVMQLVSVDIFGEGFDLPAIEVVSFARPTMSYGLFVQMFGRALRKLEGKKRAIIIDHVGNLKHGLPDTPREWTLDRRVRAAKGAPSDAIPTRTCLNEITPGEICASVYERVRECCPECGHVPVPVSRSGPEQVDGDLSEMSPEVLAAMRGEIDRVMGAPLIPRGMPSEAQYGLAKSWNERIKAQEKLRAAIELWGGWQQFLGRDTREAMKRFYFRFGIDTGTACTLGRPEAEALLDRIQADLDRHGVVDASVT